MIPESELAQQAEPVSANVSLHSPDERTWAALAHASALLNFAAGMGGPIGALVIWLTQKEKSAWVAFHALQALVFQGALFLVEAAVVAIVWIPGFIVSFATLGFGAIVAVPIMFVAFFVAIAIGLCGLVYSLYAAYQVYNGKEFRYLWIGPWLERKLRATQAA